MRNLFGIPLPERKGMKKGGSAIPRNTVIANEPHHLAYINEEEDKMLRDAGGSGIPGPGGVPAFVRIVDEYGVAHNVEAGRDADDFRANVAYNKSLLTASRTGDFSGLGEEAAGQAAQIVSRLDMGEEAYADQERRNDRQEGPIFSATEEDVGKVQTDPITGAQYRVVKTSSGFGRDYLSGEEIEAIRVEESYSGTIPAAYIEMGADLADLAESAPSREGSAAEIQATQDILDSMARDNNPHTDYDTDYGFNESTLSDPEEGSPYVLNTHDLEDSLSKDTSGLKALMGTDLFQGSPKFLAAAAAAAAADADAPPVDANAVETPPVYSDANGYISDADYTDGGGPGYSGDSFASAGGSAADLNKDGHISAEEAAANPLDQNIISSASNFVSNGGVLGGVLDALQNPISSTVNALSGDGGILGTGYISGSDFIDGGGPGYSGDSFASGGGSAADEDGDGHISAEEAAANPLDQNIISGISNLITSGGSSDADSGGLPNDSEGFVAPIGFNDLTSGQVHEDADEVILEDEVDEVDGVDCPEGHVYDSAQEMCVLDPFQQEWGEADYDAAAASVAPTNVYTAATVPENAFKALQPGIINESPAFVLPTLNTTAADLTVGTQATDPIGSQAGLAALNLDPRLASNMRETQTDMTNRFSNNASFLG